MMKGAGKMDGGALLNAIGRMFGVNLSNVLSTGIFANLKIETAGIQTQNAVLKGAEALNIRGGFIGNLAGEVFSKENMWNGITQATIDSMPVEAQQEIAGIRDMAGDGMPVAAMSYGDLGNLTPSTGGGAISGPEVNMIS